MAKMGKIFADVLSDLEMKMKKKDFVIIAAVLVTAAIFWLLITLFWMEDGTVLRISVDGEIYGEYSLKEEQEIAIGDTNRCRIEEGKVKMIEAICPDHLCLHQKAIDESGGTIVCLPNKVVLEIAGGEKMQIDSIAQ